MKKIIPAIIALLVVALIATNYKLIKRYAFVYFKTDNMFVAADTDDFDRGLAVGAEFPGIRAVHQGQEVSGLNSFMGPNGAVVVINRSVEWCPYCMRQSIELQKNKHAFDEVGINLVMMTYDAPEIQQVFINRHDIEYPLLSDINGQSFANLGVLREEYAEGHDQYGLPYPGMFVVSTGGIIKGKLFIEAYSSRVDSTAVLLFAQETLLAIPAG